MRVTARSNSLCLVLIIIIIWVWMFHHPGRERRYEKGDLWDWSQESGATSGDDWRSGGARSFYLAKGRHKFCRCEKAPQVVMACVANMVEILLNIVRILKPREWSNITRWLTIRWYLFISTISAMQMMRLILRVLMTKGPLRTKNKVLDQKRLFPLFRQNCWRERNYGFGGTCTPCCRPDLETKIWPSP